MDIETKKVSVNVTSAEAEKAAQYLILAKAEKDKIIAADVKIQAIAEKNKVIAADVKIQETAEIAKEKTKEARNELENAFADINDDIYTESGQMHGENFTTNAEKIAKDTCAALALVNKKYILAKAEAVKIKAEVVQAQLETREAELEVIELTAIYTTALRKIEDFAIEVEKANQLWVKAEHDALRIAEIEARNTLQVFKKTQDEVNETCAEVKLLNERLENVKNKEIVARTEMDEAKTKTLATILELSPIFSHETAATQLDADKTPEQKDAEKKFTTVKDREDIAASKMTKAIANTIKLTTEVVELTAFYEASVKDLKQLNNKSDIAAQVLVDAKIRVLDLIENRKKANIETSKEHAFKIKKDASEICTIAEDLIQKFTNTDDETITNIKKKSQKLFNKAEKLIRKYSDLCDDEVVDAKKIKKN